MTLLTVELFNHMKWQSGLSSFVVEFSDLNLRCIPMYQQTYWRHEGLQLLKAYIPTIVTNCF